DADPPHSAYPMNAEAYVVLTQDLSAKVDPSDIDELAAFSWHAHRMTNGKTYATTRIGDKHIPMHRLLTQCPDELEVDHANMDTLDNRRSNLRVCTRSQNLSNRRAQRNNTSGFKGVSLAKCNNLFKGTIQCNGVMYHLGYFASPAEAAQAYDAKAKE